MSHVHHGAMGSFSTSVLLALIVVSFALVYLRGWLRLRSTSSHTIPACRAMCFLVALFLIWLAVASPLATLDHELLSVHMIQHLLLMTIAPPMIWMGAPVRPLSHGLPGLLIRAVIDPMLQWPPTRRFGRALTHPVVSWLAASAVLIGWHIPAVFALGLQSETWHAVEQASFFLTGLLFWWPVIQPWPSVLRPDWTILLYLFLATLPCDILSGFLVFCDRVVYPGYFSSSHLFGFSALGDQQCAGALMWTCVTVIYLVAGTILATRLLSPLTSRRDRFVQPDVPKNTAPETVGQSLEVA